MEREKKTISKTSSFEILLLLKQSNGVFGIAKTFA